MTLDSIRNSCDVLILPGSEILNQRMREAEVSVLEKSDRGGREEVVAVATESPRMEDLQVRETQKIKKKLLMGELKKIKQIKQKLHVEEKLKIKK